MDNTADSEKDLREKTEDALASMLRDVSDREIPGEDAMEHVYASVPWLEYLSRTYLESIGSSFSFRIPGITERINDEETKCTVDMDSLEADMSKDAKDVPDNMDASDRITVDASHPNYASVQMLLQMAEEKKRNANMAYQDAKRYEMEAENIMNAAKTLAGT